MVLAPQDDTAEIFFGFDFKGSSLAIKQLKPQTEILVIGQAKPSLLHYNFLFWFQQTSVYLCTVNLTILFQVLNTCQNMDLANLHFYLIAKVIEMMLMLNAKFIESEITIPFKFYKNTIRLT
jgi:hypothetical protein